jgi:hypothetical protein
MSLCVVFYDENNIIMASDSRMSTIIEGKYHKVKDNIQKINIIQSTYKIIIRGA